MLILMFSISVVSAEENTSLTQADDYTFSVENPSGTPDMNQVLETTQSKYMESVKDEGYNEELLLQSNDDVSLKSNANNITGSGTGTFTELQELINSASNTITLEKDYIYDSTVDKTRYIRINNDIKIEGNNYKLDGKGVAGGFKSSNKNIIISNLTFLNIYTGNTGVIGDYYGTEGSIDVINCKIINATGSHAPITTTAKLTVMNCTFINNNAARYWGGGAIECTNGLIVNCTFINNSASYGGAICGGRFNEQYSGYLFTYGKQITIINCTFKNNTAHTGGAILAGNANISNCTFINNKATEAAGAVVIESSVIQNCNFSNNVGEGGYEVAGAVQISGNCTILNSSFINNTGGSGGAIIKANFEIGLDGLDYIGIGRPQPIILLIVFLLIILPILVVLSVLERYILQILKLVFLIVYFLIILPVMVVLSMMRVILLLLIVLL